MNRESATKGQSRARPDLARTTLQLLALGVLIAGTFWILSPFLVVTMWAATITVATWPLFVHVKAGVRGNQAIAVAVMTTVLLLILLVPLYFAISTIVGNADQIVTWSQSLSTLTLPPPPHWLEEMPVIGARAAARWKQVAATGTTELSTRLTPYVGTIVGWFVAQVGSIGMLLLQSLLTVVVAAILYSNGEGAADFVYRIARRLAGPQGETTVHLAAQAIRAVALGVVVTALIQSMLGGIGFAVAGVPFAALLTGLMFILGIAQIGPMPVLVGAVIWVYWKDGAFAGTAMLVWSIIVGVFDNLVRPLLIRRGAADLPLLLIFAGVLGGLVAYGIIGLFIGPVVLAVSYTLLVAWLDQGDGGGAAS